MVRNGPHYALLYSHLAFRQDDDVEPLLSQFAHQGDTSDEAKHTKEWLACSKADALVLSEGSRCSSPKVGQFKTLSLFFIHMPLTPFPLLVHGAATAWEL